MKTHLQIKKISFILLLMIGISSFGQTVLYENFTGTTLPAGWTINSTSNNPDFTWTFYDAFDDVEVYERNGTPQNEMLITPSMNLSTISNAYVNFSLWMHNMPAFLTANTANVKVLVSVNGGAFTTIWSEDELGSADLYGMQFYFRNIPKSLAAYCGSGKTDVRIGFLFTSTGTGVDYGAQAYLMNVKVSTDCPIPALKTFTDNTVTWLPIDNFAGTYDLKITENNVDTIIPNLSGTSYTFPSQKCGYKVVIRANCGGVTGAWSEDGLSFSKPVSVI